MIPYYEYNTDQMQAGVGSGINFPPHLHKGIELLYVMEGSIEATLGKERYQVQKGTLCVVFPNVVHSYKSPEQQVRHAILIYRHEFCPELEGLTQRKIPVNPLIGSLHEDISYLIDKLTDPKINQEPRVIIDSYFQLLWARILGSLQLTDAPVEQRDNLSGELIAYLTEHFTDPISLQDLSKRFGVSRYVISRIFSATIGTPFFHYLNTMRIDKAKSMLQSKKYDVLTIAYECGFESQQTFNRVFKEQCGMTPREFRKNISFGQ